MTIPMHKDARYGRLTLVSGEPYRLKGKTNLSYRCVCDCGRSLLVEGHRLRNGSVSSCGCLQKESQTNNLLQDRRRVLVRITIGDRIE